MELDGVGVARQPQSFSCPPQSPQRLAKRLRNLRKKLREIARLEHLGKSSQTESSEIQEKISRRSSVESEIAFLVGELVQAQGGDRGSIRDGGSNTNQDDLGFGFGTEDVKDTVQTFTGPSTWEKATATPGTATPGGSNRSNPHSDWDRAEGGNSLWEAGNRSCEEEEQFQSSATEESSPCLDVAIETVDGLTSHPTLIDVEVIVGKETATFRVPEGLQLMKSLGHGSYGSVVAFWDTVKNERVAVKKVPNAFADLSSGMRALRELRILDTADHLNIVKMHYFYCDEHSDHFDVYLVQECVDVDLHSVIRKSGKELTEKHHRYILYGILRGLSHLHDMNVAHRDLKPANILVNTDCSVKICDFNLSRGDVQSQDHHSGWRENAERAELSDYICTRWYRAPEVMLFKGRYGCPVDIWSLGCIVCELLNSVPVFKGSNSTDQIRQIINTVGFPLKKDLDSQSLQPGVSRLLRSLESVRGKSWHSVLPGASLDVIEMVTRLLQFDPDKRISAKECLRQAFFSKLHRNRPEDEPPSQMDWSFDVPVSTPEHLRELLCGDGCSFVGQPDPPSSLPKRLEYGYSWAEMIDDE